ncbi:MAG: hypothetical protein ACHQUC_01300 [Chlamydiales bacterium]
MNLETKKARIREMIEARDSSLCKDICTDLLLAIEALEFYANYENWSAQGYGSDEFDLIINDREKRKDRDNDLIGGKKARQALKKIAGEE